MKRSLLVLAFLLSLPLLPTLVSADCIPVPSYSSLIIEGNTVILLAGNVPVVQLTVNCEVRETSKVLLLKSTLCDGDEIEVDGERCRALSVSRR